jgi:hypothetical protein
MISRLAGLSLTGLGIVAYSFILSVIAGMPFIPSMAIVTVVVLILALRR